MVPALKSLAAYHRVYAPDLPGFGESEKPRRVLNVTGLSDSLAAWMREIRLERAALIGNSFGYQIIADLAVRHPERFERTVLQGPAIDPGREPIWNRCGDSCSTCPTNPSPSFRSNSSTTSRQRCSVGYLRFSHCWVSKARTGTEACRPFADPSLPPGALTQVEDGRGLQANEDRRLAPARSI
jgi:pimeloyl-ACP methyl ester carboxylesterase